MDLEPTFQRRLKVVTAFKGVTMRHYCFTAMDKELAQGLAGPISSWFDAERFEELQKKYLGDKVLSGHGADFIREAREARDAQLKGLK